MKPLLLLLLIGIQYNCFAQRSDVVVLKKRNKAVDRYYTGRNIEFTTNTGAYINAYIDGIKNDTFFLKEYVVRSIPTQLGVYMLDTVAVYHHKYHYNQVAVIGKSSKGFNMSGSAASLIGGGALLAVGSGVVFLADREKFSPALLIASVSLAGVGYLMAKTTGKGMTIGKKYHLVYMNLSDNKKI